MDLKKLLNSERLKEASFYKLTYRQLIEIIKEIDKEFKIGSAYSVKLFESKYPTKDSNIYDSKIDNLFSFLNVYKARNGKAKVKTLENYLIRLESRKKKNTKYYRFNLLTKNAVLKNDVAKKEFIKAFKNVMRDYTNAKNDLIVKMIDNHIDLNLTESTLKKYVNDNS